MRIHYFTAGAANMYCGSCLRDNALAAELIRQGHNVLLLPVYTPTRTDETNVSQHKVFFGGVNVYLEQKYPLFRKLPRVFDRLLDSEFLLRILAKLSISTDPQVLGAMTVSMLRGEDGNQKKEFEKLLAWLLTQPRPDIVSIPFSLLIRMAAPIKKALGCAICCTVQGEDLFLEGLQEPYRSQSLELIRTHLDAVDAFISVSEYYSAFMRSYLSLPSAKICTVPLGINLEGYGPEERTPGGSLRIGYFARIAPEKGLHTLAEAYRILRRERGLPPSRLEAGGYLGPEYRSYLRDVENKMKHCGLDQEFQYHGEPDRDGKIEFLQSLDIFSVPSSYHDPKGLSILEAMACGVPVVQPRHGAYPEVLAKTGGGVLFESENVISLADQLEKLCKEPQLARQLGRAGLEGVHRHYSVGQMAARALDVYRGLVSTAGETQSAADARPSVDLIPAT